MTTTHIKRDKLTDFINNPLYKKLPNITKAKIRSYIKAGGYVDEYIADKNIKINIVIPFIDGNIYQSLFVYNYYTGKLHASSSRGLLKTNNMISIEVNNTEIQSICKQLKNI